MADFDRADWERRVAELWASIDDHDETEFRRLIDELAGELPPSDPVAPFGRARRIDPAIAWSILRMLAWS